jgi:hypothetical protein
MAIRKTLLEKVKGFDKITQTFHNYDNLMCIKSLENGFENIVIKLDVYHLGGATTVSQDWSANFGKTKQEVVSAFSGLGIRGSFEDVINIDITEGYFVSYGEGFEKGQEVEVGTTVTVNFALFANILPDLTGKNQSQILSQLY